MLQRKKKNFFHNLELEKLATLLISLYVKEILISFMFSHKGYSYSKFFIKMKNDRHNTKEWVSPLLACVISESFFLKDTINTVFMQTTKKLTKDDGLWFLKQG